jgi:hypothetical protein
VVLEGIVVVVDHGAIERRATVRHSRVSSSS